MITRRTVGRTHLLRPDSKLKQLFVYCLAVLAERYGISVHAVVLMSTHEHLVVTDTRGELPDFIRELHRLVALGVKSLRGWQGTVWDPRKTSIVELCTAQAIVEKIAYTIANPVTAGLVRKPHEWPGVVALASDLEGAAWSAARPKVYFSRHNPGWPPVATIRLRVPPGLVGQSAEVIAAIKAELAALEEEARREHRGKRGRSVSRKSLRTQSPYRRSTTPEPRGQLIPTVAVGRRRLDDLADAVAGLRSFHGAYREAMSRWRKGIREAVFPAGTWLMRQLHRVAMDPLGDAPTATPHRPQFDATAA